MKSPRKPDQVLIESCSGSGYTVSLRYDSDRSPQAILARADFAFTNLADLVASIGTIIATGEASE